MQKPISVIFDSSTDSYDFAEEFQMTVGCLAATAKYGASVVVDGVKNKNIKGTFSLKCPTVYANGEISGAMREVVDGDMLGEVVYAFTLTFVNYQIFVGGVTIMLTNAVASLDGVMTEEAGLGPS